MAESRPLCVEHLEDRTAPAVFGLPWRDATHLSLSLAPDGTAIAGHQSELFGALNRGFASPADWQREIVRAFQTWAVHANLSVGLLADSGDRFGIAGRMQGDPRFGDIRVGAHRMTAEALAITVPSDPFLSGTLAGDVFVNSATDFRPDNLFPALLHEAGHAFGLENSSDPNSAMYSHFNPHAALTADDIRAIQALYGVRAPDRHEPNDSFVDAARIEQSPLYLGTTPLVVYGDRTTLADADYFWVRPPLLYAGPVTFQLRTDGISFLAPRLRVYDQDFNLLGEAQSTSVFGDAVSVRLPAVNQLQRYYVRVDSPAGDLFGIGRYAVAVAFDNRMLVDPSALPGILRGPYESLSAGDIEGLLGNVLGLLLNTDLHTNDMFLTAEALPSRPGYPANTRYDKLASLLDNNDRDVYRLRAPMVPAGQANVLTVTLAELPTNGIVPTVSVHDANGNPVSAEVLLNGNGTYTIQATNLNSGATYYLRVAAAPSPAPAVGNYSLVADFGGAAAQLPTFASATLSASDTQDQYALYVAQSQLFQFVLSASSEGASTSARVRLELYDPAGRLVFSLVGRAGETVSGSSIFLTPGEYRLRFTVENPGGVPVPLLRYRLRGISLSDPIGPAREDPTMEPMYTSEDDPSVYHYPDGTYSSDPYWFSEDEADFSE